MTQDQEIEGIGRKRAEKPQQREMLKKALGTILEPAAYERLMIVKTQNQQLYANTAKWIITMAQQGRLKSVDEKTLKMLLLKLSESQRRQTKIEIRRKGE